MLKHVYCQFYENTSLDFNYVKPCLDVGVTHVIKLFWEGVGDEDIG